MPQQPHPGEQQGLHKDSIEGPASSTPLPSSLGGLWAASSSKTSHFTFHFLCAPRGPRVGTCGWDPRTPTLPLSTSVDQAQHLPPQPVPCFLSRGTHLPEGIPELEVFPSVCHSAWVASGCLVRGPVAETSDQSQGSANSQGNCCPALASLALQGTRKATKDVKYPESESQGSRVLGARRDGATLTPARSS